MTHDSRLFLLLLLLLSACIGPEAEEPELPEHIRELENLTVYPADVDPDKTISFIKDAVYGDTDEVIIGSMGDLAVDDSGRVFIADIQQQTINVFEPDGGFFTQLGRGGNGPGEFGIIRSVQIREDSLYVFDPSQFKVSVFALDTLAVENTIFLARNRGNYQALNGTYPWINKIYVRNDNTYLAQFVSHGSNPTQRWQNKEIRGLLYPLDRSGDIASDKPIEFIEEIRTYHMGDRLGLLPMKPLFGTALTVLTSDNSLYWAGPDYFLFKVYSPENIYQRAFYYPIKKIPLTEESAVEVEVDEYYIQNMESMDLPQSWPVLTDMKIDDQDRLWIATTVEDMSVYQWWVLNSDGQSITRFDWPRSKPIQLIKNGYLYARETNEETGMEQIERYHLSFE